MPIHPTYNSFLRAVILSLSLLAASGVDKANDSIHELSARLRRRGEEGREESGPSGFCTSLPPCSDNAFMEQNC